MRIITTALISILVLAVTAISVVFIQTQQEISDIERHVMRQEISHIKLKSKNEDVFFRSRDWMCPKLHPEERDYKFYSCHQTWGEALADESNWIYIWGLPKWKVK